MPHRRPSEMTSRDFSTKMTESWFRRFTITPRGRIYSLTATLLRLCTNDLLGRVDPSPLRNSKAGSIFSVIPLHRVIRGVDFLLILRLCHDARLGARKISRFCSRFQKNL